MSPLLITAVVFGCVFAGALLGMGVRHWLPQHHLNSDSQDAIKLGMGLIATMSALVLGLLIASAKGAYDTQASDVREIGTDTLMLDSVLQSYGPDAADARALLASFGLFAPRNATVMAAFIVCAVSVAGAIFLILELDRPFDGLMPISNEPFRKVLLQ